MRTHSILFVVAAVTAGASSAYAQQAAAQAEALFDEGKKLMGQGKTAEACAAFESSQKLESRVTTLLNLAACREKNGELASAWARFVEAERQTRGSKSAGEKKLNQTAKDRAGKLAARLSKLTITVTQDVSGLEVLRDGTAVDRGAWNTALPVDGGSFTIVARAPGYREWSARLTLGVERDLKVIAVPALQKETAAAPSGGGKAQPPKKPNHEDGSPPDETPEDSPGPPSRVLPIALAVTGGALLGGAIVLEVMARSKYDDAKVEPDNAKQESLWKSANTRRYVAEAFAGAAVVSIGVSIFLFVRAGGSGEPEEVEARASRVRVQPVASPSLTGLLIDGTW